jgi:hypothetical protein
MDNVIFCHWESRNAIPFLLGANPQWNCLPFCSSACAINNGAILYIKRMVMRRAFGGLEDTFMNRLELFLVKMHFDKPPLEVPPRCICFYV